MYRIILVIAMITSIVKLISTFAGGIKNLDFGRKMQAKVLLYSCILLASFGGGVMAEQASAKELSLGNYLFTSDEHYFEYEIIEVNEYCKGILSNESIQEYKATNGVVITVDGDRIKVVDTEKNVIYSNAGGKIIVTKTN